MEDEMLKRMVEERDRLNIAIAVYERMKGLPSSDSVVTPKRGSEPTPAIGGSPVEVHTGAFLGMSTPKAVLQYLRMSKKAQTPRQIADALRDGGQAHAQDPEAGYLNVYSALKRMKNEKVARLQSGDWGLIEWYGGRPPKAKASKSNGGEADGEDAGE